MLTQVNSARVQGKTKIFFTLNLLNILIVKKNNKKKSDFIIKNSISLFNFSLKTFAENTIVLQCYISRWSTEFEKPTVSDTSGKTELLELLRSLLHHLFASFPLKLKQF